MSLSTWASILQPEIFIPLWWGSNNGIININNVAILGLDKMLVNGALPLEKLYEVYPKLAKEIKEVSEEIGISNLLEVAFYLSKFKNNDREISRRTRYWVIPPYSSDESEIFEKAWEFDLKNGTIAVGWNELGDVSGLSKSELEKKYKEVYGKINSREINEIWNFYHEITPGDIVIARKGVKKIVGVGIVTGKAFYNEDLGKKRVANLTDDYYPNFIKVKWRECSVEFDKRVFNRSMTVWERSEEDYRSLIEKSPELKKIIDEVMNKRETTEETKIDKIIKEKIDSLLKDKKQIILYGPPGTGKTWLAKKFVEEDLKELDLEIDRQKFVTFHPSYSYEEFVEGIRPKTENGNIVYKVEDGIFKRICREAYNALLHFAGVNKEWKEGEGLPELNAEEIDQIESVVDKAPEFYLIIDEINRGDISRIFGELITLLEADKRLFAENELIVTLPYSKTRFGIPPNLYIIGTMNTADRSIALIDVALRRRFGFIEMMPSYRVLLKELGINDVESDNDAVEILKGWRGDELRGDLKKLAVKALYVLNQKIQLVYDRDHQIGHSYFLKLKNGDLETLREIWYHEIIPLLQEYFYNDWEKLEYLLGEFVEIEEMKEFADSELVDSEEAEIYTIKELSDEEFINAMLSIADVNSSQSAEQT